MLITLWFRAISDTKRFPAGPAEGDRVASSTLHLGGRGHQRGEDTGRVPRVQGERCLECHDFTVFTIDVSATCLLDYLKWHCVRQKGEKLGYVMTHNGPITRQNLLCIAGNAHMHVFSHICRSIGRHFRCSVDVLIVTAWLKVSVQGNLLFFCNPMRNKLYTTVCMAKPFSTIFSPRLSKDYCKIVNFLR